MSLLCPCWELVFILKLPRGVPWDGAFVTQPQAPGNFWSQEFPYLASLDQAVSCGPLPLNSLLPECSAASVLVLGFWTGCSLIHESLNKPVRPLKFTQLNFVKHVQEATHMCTHTSFPQLQENAGVSNDPLSSLPWVTMASTVCPFAVCDLDMKAVPLDLWQRVAATVAPCPAPWAQRLPLPSFLLVLAIGTFHLFSFPSLTSFSQAFA